jgi:hypothetical protein
MVIISAVFSFYAVLCMMCAIDGLSKRDSFNHTARLLFRLLLCGR